MRKKWTDSQEDFLVASYFTLSTKEIAETLGKEPSQIVGRANILKKTGRIKNQIKPDPNLWSVEEVNFLIQNYDRLSAKEIALHSGMSHKAVSGKIRNLKKEGVLPLGRKLRVEDLRPWELDFIKENYLTLGPKGCASKIGRTKQVTARVANRMGLYLKFNWTPQSESFLQENFHKGTKYCAQLLGVSPSKVQARLNKLKLSIKADPRLFSDVVTGFDHKFYLDFNNPVICYLMGIFWADGCLSMGKQHRFILALVKEDFLDILWMFSLANGWHLKERHPKGRQVISLAKCYNYTFLEFLTDMDYLIKSGASADKILSQIPDHLKHYWWRGYFDGDGWWALVKGEKYGFGFSSVLDQDWTFAEKMIQQLGLTGRYISRRETAHGNSSEINCNNFDSALKFGNYIYGGYDTEITKIGLKRKHEKLLGLIAEKEESQKYYLKHRV